MGAPWLRWPGTLAQDSRMRRAGHWGGIAYRALLEMTKAQAWEGVIQKADVDGEILAGHLNVKGPCLRTWVRELSRGVDACVREKLLLDDGDAWIVLDWKVYQGDPTAADRMRRMRQRRAGITSPRQPPPHGGSNVTGVTVTPVSYGDVTGRDGTGRRDENQTAVDVNPLAAAPPNGNSGHGGGTPGTAICRECRDGLRGTAAKAECCRCPRGRERARDVARASAEDRGQEARVKANPGPHRGKAEPLAVLAARVAAKATSGSLSMPPGGQGAAG